MRITPSPPLTPIVSTVVSVPPLISPILVSEVAIIEPSSSAVSPSLVVPITTLSLEAGTYVSLLIVTGTYAVPEPVSDAVGLTSISAAKSVLTSFTPSTLVASTSISLP